MTISSSIAQPVDNVRTTSLRRLSKPGPMDATVLCHLLEMDAEFLADSSIAATNMRNAPTFDSGFMCETTLSHAQDAALWVYRIQDIPPHIQDDLSLQQQSSDEIWVRFAGVLRNDAAATITLLPNVTITLESPPPNSGSVISLATAHSPGNTRKLTSTFQSASTFQSTGISKVLVVRVTWNDSAPEVSGDDIRGRLFGIGSHAKNDYNLRRQLLSCSFGKLMLEPAPSVLPSLRSPESSAILDGVLDMHLTTSITQDAISDSVKLLENDAMQKLTQWYGKSYLSSQVNHIMLILPDHKELKYRGGKLLGYAYLKTKLSVFNNHWGTSVSAVAHELGHNFGLSHAGQDDLSYGDTTGSMGYGENYLSTKPFCYNAQKNWFLRWYEDRAMALGMLPTLMPTTLDAVLPWTGTLASFVDYAATTVDQPVLLNIQSDYQLKRLYLQYNRAKGFNEGTREYRDHVVIVQDSGSLDNKSGVQSWLVGAIAVPAVGAVAEPHKHQWKIADFASKTLHIQVCQQVQSASVDSVLISIFLEGTSGPGCPSVTQVPTLAPTTQAPTTQSPTSLAPTTQSPTTAAPTTQSPTTQPPSMQSLTTVARVKDCKDSSPGTPFRNGKEKPGKIARDCVWLTGRSLEERKSLCLYSSDLPSAYNICPETCGKCSNGCRDRSDVQVFRVQKLRGKQDCQWLRANPQWHASLCKPGLDAWEYCRETCKTCDRQE